MILQTLTVITVITQTVDAVSIRLVNVTKSYMTIRRTVKPEILFWLANVI